MAVMRALPVVCGVDMALLTACATLWLHPLLLGTENNSMLIRNG